MASTLEERVEAAPKKIGVSDFTFGETLGEGSYGDVLLCTHNQSGRKFAAKKIEKKHLVKTGNTKYAVLEREVITACNHPSIIKLSYSFRDDACLYYILELAPNGELKDLIKKTGNFDISVARFYAAELVLCLEYLHTKVNVIHRDLKPENVLLSEKMHIKVTDFGTAKRLQENETRVRTGSFLGTAEYIAPECLAEEPEVSRASDLWALGCIIFQMLAGYPPFHGDTQFLTFEQVKKAKISFPPHFPFSAKKLIKKLCHRSPERRLGYASYDKLKAHEFFDGVEWEGLFESEAPKVIANPEYSLTELSRSKWENIIGTSATVLEYGEITWHRENKASKTAFLLLTASAALVLNSSQTKILKSFEPAANSVLQAHPDYSNQFSWMVKDAEKAVLTFDDISDFDPARWTKAFKKLGE